MPASSKARYGNKNALKAPAERRVRKQYSMHRETLERIDKIRKNTGETASGVIARAVAALEN